MSDNDIIKAIDCLRGEKIYCKECACREAEYPKCKRDAAENTLALINRLQVEIEVWQNEYKRACAERDAHIATTKFIRNEAIKEFAERLEEKAITYYTIRGLWVSVKDIDNLVKEMVGERREK